MSKTASKLRIAFVGDSITVGDGDSQARGWPSRLCESSSPMPTKTHCYNLGVGGDLISNLAHRIEPELKSRLTDKEGRGVVVMIGVNDALRSAAQTNSIPIERDSIKTDLLHIVSQAKSYGPCLVVEPAPVLPEFEHRDGINGSVVLQQLDQINILLRSVCDDLGVALLSLTNSLQLDTKFQQALRKGDGLHPQDAGYELIADYIKASSEWGEFLQHAKSDVEQ